MAMDGTYNVTVSGMGKSKDGVVTLAQAGDGLQGKVEILGMTVELQNGEVNGDSFTGVVEAQTPMGAMKGKVKGSVTGDKISGKISAGLLGASFEGTRA